MDFMNEQERIDEIIRNAARDYNRPPATPKDEMWNAIVARQNAGPRLHVTAGGASASAPHASYTAPRRLSTRFAWMGMAAAAVFLVATGIGIGRYTSSSAPVQKRIASNPPVLPVAPTDEVSSTPAPETGSSAPVEKTSRVEQQQQQPKQRSREEILRNPRVVGTGGVNRLASSQYPASASGAILTPVNSTTYQVATQRHLADAEALLTSFSLGARDARMDAQFAVWAKGLLSNTRLLLDSPAGDDPRRAKLLQDLELVLAQIVQLSPNAAAQERELIEGSIQNGHVMTRLRTAIPADGTSGIPEKQ
jgi:hypothetical protein